MRAAVLHGPDLTEFIGGLRAEGLSARSVARAVHALRGFFRFAVREGLTSDDPTVDVKPPRLPRRLPKALDLDQVERLLAAAGSDVPRGLRDRALLETLFGTGARISAGPKGRGVSPVS